MKTKKLFIAAFAALALFSCSNNKENTDKGAGMAYMNFSLNFETPKKSIDNDHSSATYAPDLTKVIVKFLNGTTEVGTAKEYTSLSSEWNNLINNTAVMLEIPVSADKIEVIGNSVMTDATTITSLQGYSTVPVGGPAVVINKTTAGTQVAPYTATVTIAPLLARFEVHGKIDLTAGGGTNNSKYSKVNVKAIYFNNFKMTRVATSLTFNAQSSDHSTWYAAYQAGGVCENMSDQIASGVAGSLTPIAGAGELNANGQCIAIATGKAAGYNFFPQSTTTTTIGERASALPHIVVELECWNNEQSSAVVPHKNFITVRTFQDDNRAPISVFNPAYIYRLDLQTLAEWIKDGGEPDPDPEQDAYFINLTLTITPWTVKNVFPEL